MAVFESLGYSRFLRDGGVPQEPAETLAKAPRRFITADLASKDDLTLLRQELEAKIDKLS